MLENKLGITEFRRPCPNGGSKSARKKLVGLFEKGILDKLEAGKFFLFAGNTQIPF